MARSPLRWWGCCAAILFAWGCADQDALEAQRARLDGEHQARMRQLEAVEVRLIAVGARQRAWDELRDRHARVSAIACENVAEHVAAMQHHEEKQRTRRRQVREQTVADARGPVRSDLLLAAPAAESEASN